MFFQGIVCRIWHLIRSDVKDGMIGLFFYLPRNFLKFLIFPMLCMVSMYSALSYATYSAVTINNIEGTAPYLLLSDGVTKLTDLSQLFGVEMPSQDGSGGVDKIGIDSSEITLTAPPKMKFNQVKTLVVADGKLHDLDGLIVASDDGDATIKTNTQVGGQMRATWYNGASQPVTELNQTLTSCGGPYKLVIELPQSVSANTTYGLPRSNDYGSHAEVTYNFSSSDQGICYLAPYNMTVLAGAEGTIVKYGSGYNPVMWEVNKGFKVASKFPTTGFYKASFNVIGSGTDQSKYRCTSTDDGGKIVLSGGPNYYLGKNCTVTYNSQTRTEFINAGTPTVNLEYDKGDGSWEQIDSYKISAPIRWSIASNGSPNSALLYSNTYFQTSTSFPVLDACRVAVDGDASPATTVEQAMDLSDEGKAWRQKYLYRRDELTNTPYADRTKYPEGESPLFNGYFSRDVDGTFMGEWGMVNYYAGSVWAVNGYYWTAEIWSKDNQVEVHSNGYVHNVPTYSGGYIAVCRGE